jgi:hypothetical protein
VQVEIHGSGLATPRLGYEAFRLNMYKHTFLGRYRIAVDIAFVILCTSIFLTDLKSVVRQDFTQDRRWFAYDPVAAGISCPSNPMDSLACI